MSNKPLRIIPLGGLGEVGKNMMVYEYGENILVVDSGLMFPDNDMLGIDYIIPDMQYLIDRRDKVRGIIITHGHEDHTGAIHHLLEVVNAPVYATPLTRGLMEVKLARNGLSQKADMRTVHAGDHIEIGPFKVDFFHVCHSIPDGVGLGIETPQGLIVHTGDYKFDHTPVDGWPTDYAMLAEFAKRGVLALLSDSTNAERPGWTPSESVIDVALDQVFSKATGRIILASFASLISRMQQVAGAALRHNRKLAFVGTSMVDNYKIATKLGYLDLPSDLIISLDEALGMKGRDVVLMCTGSQGEPTSILGRLSTGSHRQLDVKAGDTIILSAHPIPGNEEKVYGTINRLLERGADVIYETVSPVHVSGHASQEEMKLLMHLTRPKFFIPIHGELRMLKQHANLGRQVGIPDENISILMNGQAVEFQNGEMRLAERVPNSNVFVDGSGVGDVGMDVMREREELSRDGMVLVNLTLDRVTGGLRTEPEVITKGFIMPRDAEDLLSGARRKISDALLKANGNMQKDLQQAVSNYIYTETHRRPIVFVTISRT
ncbi:MAG: ribonuclease J [Anaerolineaceae bacterium]|nr:ribonuclease J [Anaerolineaceae bacterium]